ncbi:MAG: acyl-CoA synthetase [Mycolicibacterium sp.]|nr:acyl-CoA synthetase [Mycolicibacterium sp.]
MAIRALANLPSRIGDEGWSLLQIARAGVLRPQSPRQIADMLRAVRDYGEMGALVRVAAIGEPDGVALIDERGPVTFGELDARSNALANEWRQRGLGPGACVAILVRNHRGFLDAFFAAGKCGARILLLNTDFGSGQLEEVVEREGVDLLVYDDEYSDAVAGINPRLGRIRAWADSPADDTIDAAIAHGDPSSPPGTGVASKIVILTSGTTGTPKGATRSQPWSLVPLGGLLGKVPFRAREVTECCAPMFHSLGFGHAMITMILGSTLVMRRRFDPQRTLDSLTRHRATTMTVVPIMLQRMLDLGAEALNDRDPSALRIIFVSGSQLGPELCTRAMDTFGRVIYNLYGSTEVAYATIATPQDLAQEPGCVGTVVRGAVVKIYDDADREAPAGTTGRIFVGNSVQFEGYTGGGSKDSLHGLMSSGDLGHFDEAGRLFIDGRDDEMIVSGGENVFPAELEETLAAHPDIAEAAVIGISDDAYGQRLRSFIVVRPGAALTEQEVKDYVKGRLARFKVPRDVRFVDALPRNPTGKVLKRHLDGEDRSQP